MYKYLTTESQVSTACSLLTKSEAIGLDTETTNLAPRKGRLRLVQLSNGENTFVIDMDYFPRSKGILTPLQRILENPKIIKVVHNFKFDHQWLSTGAGINAQGIFDTYLADLMIAAATVGIRGYKHGLDSLAFRYFKMELSKKEQNSDWSGILAESQLLYAANDVPFLPRLRKAMIQQIVQYGLEETARLEFGAISAIAEIELAGLHVNREMYQALVEDMAITWKKTEKALQELVASTVPRRGIQESLFSDIEAVDHSAINLNSYIQIRRAFRALGVPILVPQAFNKKKGILEENDQKIINQMKRKKQPFATSTQDDDLAPLLPHYPVLQTLADYREAQTALSRYGQPYLDRIEDDGRIYCNFWQLNAETGRMSATNPNLQQVPNAKEYRQCFTAPAGRKMGIMDYSQVELRILADYCQDPILLKVFRDGLDLHTMTAALLIGKTYEEVKAGAKTIYKQNRDEAKPLNFGIVYGMAAEGYSRKTGKSQKESEAALGKFKSEYRVMDQWLIKTGQQGLDSLSSRTRSGRLVKFAKPNTKGEEGGVRRNARNTPIQGTSADITKLALTLVHKALKASGLDVKIVHVVHDEIVLEGSEQDIAAACEITKKEMILAGEKYIKTVPVLVDVSIGDSWAEK